MRVQKQLSQKRGEKQYYRYTINIPQDLIDESGFKEGDELEGKAIKGEIKLRKKQNG